MKTPQRFKQSNAVLLTRADARLTFLYLDLCRIEQDDNGTHARIDREDGTTETWYLPSATLTTLLLGPGTSITNPAATELTRNGCSITFVGSGAVRSYATFLSPYAPTHLLERQAAIAADPALKVACATEMYLKRFNDLSRNQLPTGLTIEALRGLEGARMKATYATHARRVGLRTWRRQFTDAEDPVNIALNYANTALYGITNAVITTLGMAPGLGIIHTGNRQSFVLDIADLYKTTLTIPLAFSLHDSTKPGPDAMARLRADFKLIKLLPRIITDIHDLLGVALGDDDSSPTFDSTDWTIDSLKLWGPNATVLAGDNYDQRPQ